MAGRTAAVAALALLLLAGCARPAAVGGPGTAAADVHDAWTSCAKAIDDPRSSAGASALELPRLPADFTPAGVVVCAMDLQTRADGGQDEVMAERHGSKVDGLTAALRLPDKPLTATACDLDLPGVAWFAMIDAGGRWVRPGIAHDDCGKLRIEVRDAVEHLELRTVATTVLAEMKSAAAAKAGCEQQWSDMVGTVTSNEPAPQEHPFDPPKSDVRLCVYTVPASEQGSAKPAGTFERGGPLPAATWTALRSAMLPAGPARPCPAHASRFALFRPAADNGGEVYVELDGCYRMLWFGPSGAALRQGSAAIADQITKAL
ncbi:hypothetical protein [Dactylosporangium sp. CA-139066]|uniref:hypothetical protein n=1 Tax=Dactylosporangium sp. CA-139066 TaxID=3239930 RepID=UPI003D90F684